MRRTTFLVFGIALSARILCSAYQIIRGMQPITWFPSLVLWPDFYRIYGHQLSLLAQGLMPYRDFAYNYPPLFLLTLLPPYLIGGIVAASSPIILFDALSAPLIYVMVSEKVGHRLALTAALAYALSPLMLFDVGFLWLGSQPVTFFVLLSFYYIQKDQPLLSSIFLGVAALFQQEALFTLPVQMSWQVRQYGRKAWKGAMLFLIVILLVSSPFLALAAHQYIAYLSYGLLSVGNVSGVQPVFPSITNSSPAAAHILTQLGPCSSTTSPLTSSFLSCVRYPNPIVTLWVDSATWISEIIVIPLMVLLIPAIYASKDNGKVIEILASYSLIVFLVAFSFLVHTTYAYYFIPVYALLISASKTSLSVMLIVLISTLSLTVAAGPFLEVLSLGAVLTTLTFSSQPERALQRSG